MGIITVSHSMYAVTIQEYRTIPFSSLAIVAPYVLTMVPSRHAMSIASVRPTIIMLRTFGSMFSYVICLADIRSGPWKGDIYKFIIKLKIPYN